MVRQYRRLCGDFSLTYSHVKHESSFIDDGMAVMTSFGYVSSVLDLNKACCLAMPSK